LALADRTGDSPQTGDFALHVSWNRSELLSISGDSDARQKLSDVGERVSLVSHDPLSRRANRLLVRLERLLRPVRLENVEICVHPNPRNESQLRTVQLHARRSRLFARIPVDRKARLLTERAFERGDHH